MTIDNLTIDNGTLTRYQEEVSKLKLAIRDSSVKSESAVSKLKDFFEAYFKECYQKNMLDSQNAYFAKQATQQFLTIVKDNLKLSDDELEKCVSKALNGIDLSKYSISQTAIDKIKKDVGAYFKSIADILDFNFGKKPLTKDEEEKAVKKLHDDAEDFVNKNMEMPSLNLDFISNFLETNVFSNFDRIIKRESLEFERTAIALVNSKKIGFKAAFTKLYVPPIITLYKQFRKYEKFSVNGIGRKVKKNFKRLGKGLYNAIDFFLPLTFLKGLFKISRFIVGTGLKLISGAFSLGMTIVSRSLNFAFSGIKLVTGTILKIGVGSFKLLTKTLSKIGLFKAFKFTTKIIVAFFKSYPGAFLLGYVVGTIYKNFRKIINFANDLFEKAKTTFDEHIYNPFILPAIEWFNGISFSFYIDEIKRIIFDDNGENKFDKIISELRIVNKNTGKPLLVYGKSIQQNIYELTEWFDNAIDNITFSNLIEHVIAPIGGAMIGGAVGSKFGMLAGAAIAPPVGAIVGGAIGYLVGSIGGEWLGGKIGELFNDKGGFKGAPKRTDNGIEYTARSLLGETNVVKDVFYDVRKSSRIKSIESFGRRIENFEIDFDAPNEGEPDKLQEYIDAGVLTSEEVRRIRSSPEATASFQEQAIMLRNLGRLTYDKIYQEIRTSYHRFAELVNDKNHKGYLTTFMMSNNDFTTTLTLDGSTFNFGKRDGFNPFFFKIFRAMSLQDIIQDLALNRNGMTITKFFEIYNKINTPEGLIDYSKENGYERRTIFKGQPAEDISQLIFPKYNDNAETRMKIHTFLVEKTDQSYLFSRLPPENRNKIIDFIVKDIAKGPDKEKYESARRRVNYEIRTKRRTLPRFLLDVNVKPYITALLDLNQMVFMMDFDENQGFFSSLFDESHLARYDTSIMAHSGAFSSLRNADTDYKALTTAMGGLDNLKTLYDTSIKSLPYLTDEQRRNLSMDRVLSRVAIWNKDAIERGELSGSELEDRIRHSIEFAVQSELKDLTVSTTLNREVLEAIGSRLEAIQTLTSSDEIPFDAEAISVLESKADLAGISELLSQYHELIKANIDFSNEKLIPVIRRLSEKGIGKDKLEQVFGHNILAMAFSEESSPNPTDSVAGDSVSPSIE